MEIVNAIYILKLEKNDGTDIQKNITDFWGATPVQFYNVAGKTTSRNEGSIDLSLWRILKHDYVDDVALDICKNHVGMIQEAFQNNHETVLFMEEDARFEPLAKNKLERMNRWLRKHQDRWDIFYMGYCNWPWLCSFMVSRDVIQPWSPLAAHCYLLNRRGMEKVLRYTANGEKNVNIHADKLFTQIPSIQKYAAFPMICFQKKDPALFLKACDRMNINISMKTVSCAIQYISLMVPVILILTFVYFLMRVSMSVFSLRKKPVTT